MADTQSTLKAHACAVNAMSWKSPNEGALEDKEKAMIGKVFWFSGGSHWLVTKALSRLIYQQGEPPFEARQVFECTCIYDPDNHFYGEKEAVVKIKYQIKGHKAVIHHYEQHLKDRQELLAECTPKNRERRLKQLAYAEELLYQATHPVNMPHRHTSNEIIALRHFYKKRSSHTPQLLDAAMYPLTLDTDDQAMVGGFMIGLLMTKVPGKQLQHDTFWYDKDRVGRDEIRAAFKTALLELWSYHIHHDDCALRNIIWDEDERKCYIVDFEDYASRDITDPEAFWNRLPRWSQWGLAEDEGPSSKRIVGGGVRLESSRS